jgi:phosphoribosyl 1,2-cyclic phosphodiesterase
VKVTLWGTRGSIPTPGPETARYGGNTSCVHVQGDDGTHLVLDAGTGIRRLGDTFPRGPMRVDLLLSHLHMDHIQGLGFFAPLYDASTEVHIWGPASTTQGLGRRLTRYLAPPLFPVLLRDLPCDLHLHEVPCGDFEIGGFRISAAMVCHPGPTVGYRIVEDGRVLTYLSDHEPALGMDRFELENLDPDWVSGYELAEGADLLIHDTQYTPQEYQERIGWGHSSVEQCLTFARLARVKHLVAFHHDPARADDALYRVVSEAAQKADLPFKVTAGAEGDVFKL